MLSSESLDFVILSFFISMLLHFAKLLVAIMKLPPEQLLDSDESDEMFMV